VFDVLIAGGGVAGLACAARLAKAGFYVCLIERKNKTGFPVCCGEAVSKKSLHSSGFFDMSYIDSQVKGYRINYPGNNYMEVDSEGYLLDRGAFEKHLTVLAEKAGAEILLKTTILSCSQDGEGVNVSTTLGEYKTKYLIAADGPESVCASSFSDEKNKYVHGIQYRIKEKNMSGINPGGGFLNFYFDKLSLYYFWNFEKNNCFNAGGCVPDKTILSDFIKKRITDKAYKTADFTRGKIPTGGLKKNIVFGKTALIGDAAGAINPVSLAGIYGALLSANLCVDAVIMSLKTGSNRLLSYENNMKRTNLAAFYSKYLAKHCYNYPEKVLLFLGEYYRGRNFLTVDVPRFLKLVIKYPVVLGFLIPLLLHRWVLKNQTDNMW